MIGLIKDLNQKIITNQIILMMKNLSQVKMIILKKEMTLRKVIISKVMKIII